MLRLGHRRVAVPLRDPALFTDVPRWQAYVRDDPLTLREVTIRFAAADRDLTRYAREEPRSIRVPTLLVLAGRDRIVENEPTRAFFRQLGTEDRQLVEFPDAAHTLEFDPACGDYCRAIGDWAKRCIDGGRHARA